jgi:hypothetical protein
MEISFTLTEKRYGKSMVQGGKPCVLNTLLAIKNHVFISTDQQTPIKKRND